MITFSCKKIKEEELIRCSFGLNKTSYNLFMFLLKEKGKWSVSSIAEKMSLERTTIQKAIKSLLEKNLVKRMQRNLENGGYIFLYEINEKEEIKKRMKTIVREWYKSVEEAIEKL